jgi:hypothetical protein
MVAKRARCVNGGATWPDAAAAYLAELEGD